MSGRLIVTIVAFGLAVLIMGAFFPTFIDAAEGTVEATSDLEVNQNDTLGELLEIELTSVDGDNATFELTETRSADSATINISATNSSTVTLAGEEVTSTVDSVDEDSAIITTEYPPAIGWAEGAKLFVEQTGLLLALVAFIVTVAMLAIVMRGV